MPINLTDGAIAKVRREVKASGVRRNLSDSVCTALMIRVTPGGAATWTLACRDPKGDMRSFFLGHYPAMGIGDARNAARKMYVEIKAGADPIAERDKLRAIAKDATAGIGTLKALLDVYESKGKPGSKLKSWKEQRQAIANVFAKHLDRPLATMKASDLQMTADAHKAEYAASLAVRCLRPVLKWASVSSRGYAPAGLADIHPPATVQRRDRVVSEGELAALLPALRASSRPYAAAMRFMLLTLARRDEVGSARWTDIDMDARTWTITETKNGERHVVPLSRQAMELLRSRLPEDGKPDRGSLIFATSTGATLGNWDRETKVIQQASGTEGWNRHDLRRTGASMLGEMGVEPHIIEGALNHVSIHSRLAATYNKSRYRPQVADALQMLADRLDTIETGATNVIPLRRA